jgi:hypothetical protein
MRATAAHPLVRKSRAWLPGWPSMPDLFFASVMLALFGKATVWQALLGDGDTGWHVRVGQIVLRAGQVPMRDPFSFSRPGAPWFAWEWLSEVILARLHSWQGLAAVAAVAVLAVCFWSAALFCWMLRRGSVIWLAALATLAAVSASSVHFLARPHIFSLLLLVPALWIVDEDRRAQSPLLWLLVPLAALWANLHGGFAGWLANLILLVAATLLERDWPAARRYGLLALLSSAATLLNPYGPRLHQHIAAYLSSPWILDHVQEFQSPRIRAENMLVFALLLVAALALTARPASGRSFDTLLVLFWGLAALRSARHIPWFATVAAPVIASACTRWWARYAQTTSTRSAIRIFWDAGIDLGRRARFTAWLPVLGCLSLLICFPRQDLTDFPSERFPVDLISRNADLLTATPRILTTDQWADYLIYRFHPSTRVFFDGRSDFYGPEIGQDYEALLDADRSWRAIMTRYQFSAAFLPLHWPLSQLLEQEPGWRVVARDSQAILLLHDAAP